MGKLTVLQAGDKYGRLTIVKKYGVRKKPCGTTESEWLCKCDCGNEIIVLTHNIRSGNTKSCGCLSREKKKGKRFSDNKGVINHIILQYKRHARERGLSWGLEYEDVKEIISEPCFYCGCINSNHHVTKNCKEGFDHNGIDRVDSSKGYEIGNVVPCCRTCNMAKNNMDVKEFVMWVQRTAEHTKQMAEQWGGIENGT